MQYLAPPRSTPAFPALPPRPPGWLADRPPPGPGFRSLDPSGGLGVPQGAAFSLGG
ncbi:hypothetical protein [Roseateles asaccharophilus]|uniref:Uncharacterized protein n=1 Tax=Roseateles asaccharophilus TaxID=582607 RepID=A0ABU2AFR8_9BURK|nr:hypothetical protein [Roseateles asaccharophilus]MDR7335920.1 hypothetical protein [Roseateles asaccharophilus]